MRLVPTALNLAVIAGVTAVPTTAQQPPIPLGTRVRITTPAARTAGRLVRLRTDTVAIDRDGSTLVVPAVRITRFDVSRGRRSRTGRGALLGALIGTAAGIAAGAILCSGDRCESSGGDFAGVGILALGGGGLLAGLGIGAVAGALVTNERWEEVSLRRIRTAVLFALPVSFTSP